MIQYYYRTDGPAIMADDWQEWWKDGKLHNDVGPARLFKSTLRLEWWMNGEPVYVDTVPEELFMKYWRNE